MEKNSNAATARQRLRLLRLPQLNYPKCKAGLYADIADGLFPPPVKLERVSTWPEYENELVIAARIAGKSRDEIKALVRELIELRKNALNTQQAA